MSAAAEATLWLLIDAAHAHRLGHALDMHIPALHHHMWPVLVLIAIIVLILAPDRSIGELDNGIAAPARPGSCNTRLHRRCSPNRSGGRGCRGSYPRHA